jgi:hypothetical protein
VSSVGNKTQDLIVKSRRISAKPEFIALTEIRALIEKV